MLLLLALLATLPSTALALQGDVTSDGIVTMSDVLLVQQHLEGQVVLSTAALARADMKNDGKVDIADVIAIRLTVADGASQPVVMLPVAAGTFTMGARDDEGGVSDEFPRHDVTLSAYQIGKFAVTNGQYCDVLNWALARGYVKGDASGGAYTGHYVYSAGLALIYVSDPYCNIQYSGGAFSAKIRIGTGSIQYSMATHPVIGVTWHGSVVFCNWLSEKEGLTAAYNTATWELVDADTGTPGIQFTNGYRLPTEAERERAAAWDGSKHWIYGFLSDSISSARCNYDTGTYVNPLGLTSYPNTSPVGWFNGINISPNGSVQTINSPSPVGAYDMSGNVLEWCHDKYDEHYYNDGNMTDPTGPVCGASRVLRGGSWNNSASYCRSASRFPSGSDVWNTDCGFRVACATSGSAPGTILLYVMPGAAQWTLSGPAGFIGNGQTFTDDRVFSSAPAGAYTWKGLSLAGYDTPATQTQVLAVGTTITFNAAWMSSEGARLPVAMLPVAAGTFIMGARDDEYGSSDEKLTHTVTLSAYQIGKYAVTNGQYCDVLNWALARGYVKGDTSGGAYTNGSVFASGQALLGISDCYCNILCSEGVFSAKTRAGAGSVYYAMATHPVVCVSWYGSVVFCNWLSEKEGLTPAYNTTTWELVDTDAGTPGIQFTNGYRLPTEAEWERAAGWNGTTHWIYGFQSDTLTGKNRCNYYDSNPDYVNPLGLTSYPYTSPVYPYTSPVGWFNGVNISPNGSVQTINSPSPVGAYDMSGNVMEWCHDGYEAYSSDPQTNPVGPGYGLYGRVLRGGCWTDVASDCRSAKRASTTPNLGIAGIGFRIARAASAP
ncbi:MAG: SUMF1/EgtB/PvdO family nonheme iron enzyme [Candidatus Sumerlaeota bacterium]|nr:SUMF1/EgtB/PvdO family nonheme iron enzyme [Candidatus Sumerlaeota bacterium]